MSMLPSFELTPASIRPLSNPVLRRLVNYLNRWEAFEDTLACLAEHEPLSLVSLIDAQITALARVGRYPEAIQIAETRLTQKDSNTARMNLANLYLESGDLDAASAQIREIAGIDTTFGRIHLAQGRIALLQGQLDKAEAAFLEYQKQYQFTRSHLPYLAQIALARGDRLTAAAYAVRAITVGEGESPVAVAMLREVRTLFIELDDDRRVAEINAQIARRAEVEREEILAALAEDRGEKSRPERVRTPKETTPARPTAPALAPAPPLPDLNTVPVSEQERTDILAAAQGMFSFNELRPAQAEIIACVRRRENVLTILPTGAGKSLCYQLPAFMSPGLTLVVSPLIALMKDQLDGLPVNLRPRAVAINSTLDGPALIRAIEEIAAGRYQLVYVAPERLRQLPFLAALTQAGLTQLVIDEAHCVSVWGHDFRPDYLYIAGAWEELNRPPILALTATAPPRVREDIERRLFGSVGERKFRYIALDTFRANLRLSGLRTKGDDKKRQLLIRLCKERKGSGIVYARSRARCEELAAMLREQGVNAVHYHAGMDDRAGVQEKFMSGAATVIVATIAFGMGVDKADIRYIIHYDPPDSVEAYYQEAGRAGRDGLPSDCILMYADGDKARLTRQTNQGAISIEFLRTVYGWMKRMLPPGKPGLVNLRELVMVAEGEEVKTRVALSLLEQAGLLQRHHDAPVQVTLRPLPDQSDDAFEEFVESADLTPHQPNQRPFLQLAERLRLTPSALEYRLLKWEFAGLLEYRPIGRTYLYSLPTPPADAARRLEALLDQYAVIQGQRVQEIWEYVRTGYCRHGHLAAYLGGAPREKCESCDTCKPGLNGKGISDADADLPPESEQYRTILQTLREKSWGRGNLTALLNGNRYWPNEAIKTSPIFGTLSFRSVTELDKMVTRLLQGGFLGEKTFSGGGVALELTRKGQTALNNPRLLDELTAPPPPARPPVPPPAPPAAQKPLTPAPYPEPRVSTPSAAAPTPEPDAKLLADLRAWRVQRAHGDNVPPYVVAHNAFLEDIARYYPQSKDELLQIKGFGASRVEKYGEEILALVRANFSTSQISALPTPPTQKVEIPPNAEPDPDLYKALQLWCLARAQKDKVQTYMILPKETIRLLAIVRPQTLQDLERVKGMGPKKVEMFGEEIIGVIREMN
ncbi:MAG: RecQ family ATP-dependent DNA helicase [Anaerolineales bacterium]|nr:RecQ family ATP-dependent DNA helicase [Anaerolineales bacterium]